MASLAGLLFRQVSAGGDHSCGVTTDDRAYCWGKGDFGQLGVGRGLTEFLAAPPGRRTQIRSRDSRRVAHLCRGHGQPRLLLGLRPGRRTELKYLAPVPVSGGLLFAQLAAGGSHTCGLTAVRAVYCWGENRFGQLGDGTLDIRLTPTAVLGRS